VYKQKQQSGIVHLAIIIVLIVALLGVLGFVYWQNFIQPKNSTTKGSSSKSTSDTKIPAVKTDPLVGWKTYTNTALGFSIKYPSDWQVSDGIISPQTYIDYQTKKYGNLVGPLVYFGEGAVSGVASYAESSLPMSEIYEQDKATFASTDGNTSTPSYTFTSNGLSGFYINQKTSSYSDNIYVVELSQGKHVVFTNRESDKAYSPGGASVTDQNDYTNYSSTITEIIKTINRL